MLPVSEAEFREMYSPHISYLDTEKINLPRQKTDMLFMKW